MRLVLGEFAGTLLASQRVIPQRLLQAGFSFLFPDIDAALADNDVAYISSLATEAALGTKLVAATIGVVNEQGALVDELGFGQQSVGYKSRIEIDVIDNTNYITEPFPTGLLTILTAVIVSPHLKDEPNAEERVTDR